MESNEEEYSTDASMCAKCGKKIIDEESSFCAYCGSAFDPKPQGADFTIGAGILAIIAATFSIAIGVLGFSYYQSYLAYYTSYGMDTSASIGFLLIVSFAFVSSIFGFAGGILAMTKKRFKFSVGGILVMLASALFTFIALWRYQFGFPDALLLLGISIGVFSLASAVFVIRSKTEFTQTEHISI